jgi:hypothetical protein
MASPKLKPANLRAKGFTIKGAARFMTTSSLARYYALGNERQHEKGGAIMEGGTRVECQPFEIF